MTKQIIIIPVLKEKQNLVKLIPDIFKIMPDVSILIVDDNSLDGTKELIQALQLEFPKLFYLLRKSRFGYGNSMVDGMKWVLANDYKFIVTMDADFSHPYKLLPQFFSLLEKYTVVIGSRYIAGGKIENWNFFRRILSRLANFYVKVILNIKLKDVTTGFVGYGNNAVREIIDQSPQSTGYSFLVETKYKLIKTGYIPFEFPITFTERREGQSKMRLGIIFESILIPWYLFFKKIDRVKPRILSR